MFRAAMRDTAAFVGWLDASAGGGEPARDDE